MSLLELYNLKLNEYKETGLREKPSNLLAMLLLSEKYKYEPLKKVQGEFYKKYKKEIDTKIEKVEKDFNFTVEDIIEIIEETIICNNYPEDRIWFAFAEGFGALSWGLLYHNDKTPEEIYSKYFDNNDLKKYYDIEQKALANNIAITQLNDLINKILSNPKDFYKKICEELTADEQLFILNELQNKSCMNCTNGSCNVEYSDKIGIDELGNPQGNQCLGWHNSELIGRSKVLRKTDINKLK